MAERPSTARRARRSGLRGLLIGLWLAVSSPALAQPPGGQGPAPPGAHRRVDVAPSPGGPPHVLVLGGVLLGGTLLLALVAHVAWPVRLRVRAALVGEMRREVRDPPPIDVDHEVRLAWRAEIGGFRGCAKPSSDPPASEPGSQT